MKFHIQGVLNGLSVNFRLQLGALIILVKKYCQKKVGDNQQRLWRTSARKTTCE
jgi:hypothetical protein